MGKQKGWLAGTECLEAGTTGAAWTFCLFLFLFKTRPPVTQLSKLSPSQLLPFPYTCAINLDTCGAVPFYFLLLFDPMGPTPIQCLSRSDVDHTPFVTTPPTGQNPSLSNSHYNFIP